MAGTTKNSRVPYLRCFVLLLLLLLLLLLHAHIYILFFRDARDGGDGDDGGEGDCWMDRPDLELRREREKVVSCTVFRAFVCVVCVTGAGCVSPVVCCRRYKTKSC